MLFAKATVRKPSQALLSKDSQRLAVIPENTIAESAKLSYDIGILLPTFISSSKRDYKTVKTSSSVFPPYLSLP
jgi:hypothetical protein